MSAHATQLHFEPMGRGMVALIATRGELADITGDTVEVSNRMVEKKILEVLAYPEQGRMIGKPPIDEEFARRLDDALAEVNTVLEELAG